MLFSWKSLTGNMKKAQQEKEEGEERIHLV